MPAILLKSRFFYGGIGAIFALATLHGPLAKAQEPGPELRALLQAQQARMVEQAKVLAEQALLDQVAAGVNVPVP